MAAKVANHKQKNGLYQRNDSKIWWGSIRYKKADGSPGRWRGSLDTEAKSLAVEKLAAKRAELKGKRESLAGSEMLFEVACNHFFDQHVAILKPSTQSEYALAFIEIIGEFRGMSIGEIRRADVREFETELHKREVLVSKTKQLYRKISTGRVRGYLSYLSSFFTFCVEQEWLETNPMLGYLKMRAKAGLKKGQPRTRYADHGEEQRLVEQAWLYQHDYPTWLQQSGAHRFTAKEREFLTPMHDAVVVALDTGMRDTEQKHLARNWINESDGVIIVPASIAKSGKERRIPIMPRVAEVLKRAKWHPATGLMFWHGEGGKPYDNWNKAYAAIKAAAKIQPHLSWHDLRRTYGCRRLQDDGLSMEEVKELLGHSSVAVTERHYAFLKISAIVEKMKKKRAS